LRSQRGGSVPIVTAARHALAHSTRREAIEKRQQRFLGQSLAHPGDKKARLSAACAAAAYPVGLCQTQDTAFATLVTRGL